MAGYAIIYQKKKPKNTYLFLVSIFFYYKTSGVFVILLILSIIAGYYIGKKLTETEDQKRRKFLIASSIFVNLFVLAYYKYTKFFIESINSIFGSKFEAVDLFAKWTNFFTGTHFSIDKIILPVGISFFTFQVLSYTIDVYRKKLKAVDNLIDFGFYVSFFPQLVAGPIVRASEFIPQIYEKYKVSKQEFGIATFMILNGLFKKLVIADFIAVNFVDRVFSNPKTFSGFENLMALYGYSLQVYADFSGYTDVAIGVALLMGYRLSANFNSPYKATSTGEFWKRWHISLSTWLKDYLYIPLGGNQKSATRTNINLMITMLLGGLWHGASWQFVIWGGLNGIGIVVYKLWRKISPIKDENTWSNRFYAIFLTFNFITITRIWFRSETMETANNIMYQIVNSFYFNQILEVLVAYKNIFALMLFGYIIHWLPATVKKSYREAFVAFPQWVKAASIVVIVFVIWQARSAGLQPFIYFQF
jgi:D-alanyl-lipoteichoic acid acyltransferase DltB (MBOAT superfamily)